MNSETINPGTVDFGKLNARVLNASSLASNDVYDPKGEKLGSVKEIMLDTRAGKISYVVLSFGGFLSIGEKLFAVPWGALTVDTENKRLVMDTNEERLKEAPGFDADNWPNMADPTWEKTVHAYYGTQIDTTY